MQFISIEIQNCSIVVFSSRVPLAQPVKKKKHTGSNRSLPAIQLVHGVVVMLGLIFNI